MTALYYGKLTPQNAAASQAAAGFPASNVLLEALGRYWRTPDGGTGIITFTVAFAAQQFISAFEIHDVNFTSATVFTTPDGVNFTNRGAINTYADRHGRRRGLLQLNLAAILQINITIPTGTPTDGLNYWRMGAQYAFASKFALPVAPVYPLPVRTRRPRLSQELANGVTSVATTGMNVDRVTVNFMQRDTEALDTLIQKATAGICVLDAEYSPYPAQIWPVRMLEQDFEETHTGKRLSTFQAVVTEAVASP